MSKATNTGENINKGTETNGTGNYNKSENYNNKNNSTSEKNRDNNISRTNMYTSNSQSVSPKGGTPEIVALVGLKSEKLKMVFTFDVFYEKNSNYIIKNL